MPDDRPGLPFESLDFLYTPSRDAAADCAHCVRLLGGRLVFAIAAFGTPVAMVRVSEAGPAILFTEHLDGERPILVYRVADLQTSEQDLARSGCVLGHAFEI